MPDSEIGRVTLYVARGGSAFELRQFLQDMESAYVAMAKMEVAVRRGEFRRSLLPIWFYELGLSDRFWSSPTLLPQERLEVTAANFSSPGEWVFSGVVGALKELREWLKYRDEKRKDREWREPEEKRQMQLESELLEERVRGEKMGRITQLVHFLKEAGVPDEEIQRIMWREIGVPLSKLSRHQDSGLLTDQREAEDD